MRVVNNPKNTLKSAVFVIFACVFAMGVAGFSRSALAAAAGTIYLTPNIKSVANGETFNIEVRGNATSGNAALVSISYPSSNLDLLSYSTKGAAFTEQAAAPMASAGTFSYATFASPGTAGMSGDVLLLTLTFRAKSSTGTANVTVNSNSAIASAGLKAAGSGTGTVVAFNGQTIPGTQASSGQYIPPTSDSSTSGSTGGLISSSMVVVKNSKGQPFANADVTFTAYNFTKTYKTDKDGRIIVSNIPSDKQLTMTVRRDGKQVAKQDVTLAGGAISGGQEIVVKKTAIMSKPAITAVLAVIAIAVLVGLLIVLVRFIKKKRRRSPIGVTAPINSVTPPTPPTPTPSFTPQQPIIMQPNVRSNPTVTGDNPIVITPEHTDDTAKGGGE